MDKAAATVRRKSLREWFFGIVFWLGLGCGIPLAATLYGNHAGWFYSEPELSLFPACMVLSVMIGVTLAYKFGAFARDE
ncbi:hypothetical protein ACT2FY_38750 [Paraburkholderia fungorum]|uniref:hypothetical protein n=1 Tax=Paraburkholderia fungorum TaxID=134537 RepID=UPI00402B0BE2